jgi:argininosuccinate synthase
MEIIAPWRSWPYEGRGDLLAYAAEHDLDVPVTAEKPYSSDRNLMHISHEGGILEDPWQTPPEDMFQLTANPADAPPARDITITFEAGVPIAVDGAKLELVALIEHMNEIVGAYGIGRLDIVENRVIGLKSRGVYETPGVSVLMQAWRGLQTLAFDRPTLAWIDSLGMRLADQTYDGVWFAPECKLVRSAVAEAAATVSGETRIRLEAGRATLLGRRSTSSEYNMSLASFDEAGGFDQSHATGYIKLAGLRLGAGA